MVTYLQAGQYKLLKANRSLASERTQGKTDSNSVTRRFVVPSYSGEYSSRWQCRN
ncbi:MAG UNVERIFIED_CONTAM: hypothetical protein LVR29_01215 [Microcystis novacekii LVE1205-3]